MANPLPKSLRVHSFGINRHSPNQISPPVRCHLHSQARVARYSPSSKPKTSRTDAFNLRPLALPSPKALGSNGAPTAPASCRFFTTPSWDAERNGADIWRPSNRSEGSYSPQNRDVFRKQMSRPRRSSPASVHILIDGKPHAFSPIFLRDSCDCPKCVDPSTRQKLFSTTDIPANIQASVEYVDEGRSVSLTWFNDTGAAGSGHTSRFSLQTLRNCADHGRVRVLPAGPRTIPWTNQEIRDEVRDVDYEAYMSDDRVLLRVLQQLRSHGLIFVTSVPESSESVSKIGERIGPLKNTFYGLTWDVRSVPQAKNVAYTAQDLGFHMDLMYMVQPPHLQLLHCIRSSSVGGASLFTDGFRAAADLCMQDPDAFRDLSRRQVRFHYDHPGSHYYNQSATVIDARSGFDPDTLRTLPAATGVNDGASTTAATRQQAAGYLRAIAWSPPFQAPFAHKGRTRGVSTKLEALNDSVDTWHAAAAKFNALLHQPEGIYKRMMKPGECVIFDNRRVLHAREAFEVDDAGKERWLRGAYLDRDPYYSKLLVLSEQLAGDTNAVA